MAASRTIFVAGAGIGGLTASLALAAKGFRVVVLEKAERLEEAGAGLQLSPNASRVLVELGLQPRLAQRAVTPDAISLMSARSGGEVARLPLGEAATFRAGAPYWVVHRADLQAALQAEVKDNPDIELRLGCQFEDVASHAKGLTVVQRSGMTRQQELALALVGADGIWSAVRHHLFPEVQPQFSGLIAWRGTLEPPSCRANIPRAGSSSGWDRTRILSPIRSRAGARSTSWRWCRGHGTGRAGAPPAKATKSETVRVAGMAGPRADDDRRGRRLAEMGAVHSAR